MEHIDAQNMQYTPCLIYKGVIKAVYSSDNTVDVYCPDQNTHVSKVQYLPISSNKNICVPVVGDMCIIVFSSFRKKPYIISGFPVSGEEEFFEGENNFQGSAGAFLKQDLNGGYSLFSKHLIGEHIDNTLQRTSISFSDKEKGFSSEKETGVFDADLSQDSFSQNAYTRERKKIYRFRTFNQLVYKPSQLLDSNKNIVPSLRDTIYNDSIKLLSFLDEDEEKLKKAFDQNLTQNEVNSINSFLNSFIIGKSSDYLQIDLGNDLDSVSPKKSTYDSDIAMKVSVGTNSIVLDYAGNLELNVKNVKMPTVKNSVSYTSLQPPQTPLR